MTKREIASLACKILALWLFAQAALHVGGFLLVINKVAGIIFDEYRWEYILPELQDGFFAVVYALIGYIFWIKSNSLAALMVQPNDGQPTASSGITKEDWTGIAAAAVGIYVLVKGFSKLVLYMIVLLTWVREGKDIGIGKISLLSAIIESLLGIGLILGSRWLARLIWKIRGRGANSGSAE